MPKRATKPKKTGRSARMVLPARPPEEKRGFSWLHLAAFIAACELAGVVGAIFTAPNIPTWYAALAKPAFTPPSWLFGPAWTLLYALMGAVAYLVYLRPENGARSRGLRAFFMQLGLNVLWSVVFFGMQSPGLGLAVIVLLWFCIAATMALFWRVSRRAAWLMLPYLLWVSFAAYLNFGVWILNP